QPAHALMQLQEIAAAGQLESQRAAAFLVAVDLPLLRARGGERIAAPGAFEVAAQVEIGHVRSPRQAPVCSIRCAARSGIENTSASATNRRARARQSAGSAFSTVSSAAAIDAGVTGSASTAPSCQS